MLANDENKFQLHLNVLISQSLIPDVNSDISEVIPSPFQAHQQYLYLNNEHHTVFHGKCSPDKSQQISRQEVKPVGLYWHQREICFIAKCLSTLEYSGL